MKKIKIVIECGKDLFSAYAENMAGVYGGGETIQEAKQSALKGLELYQKYNNDYFDYEITYRFDVESLLTYYKGIFTNAALERLTGINQRLLQHYSSGLRKPRPAQRKKIETALHNLGRDLVSLEL